MPAKKTAPKRAAAAPAAAGPRFEMVPIDRLKENPQNPRVISEDTLARLTKSIQHFGFVSPVIAYETDGTLEVVVGHQRLRAARATGDVQLVPTYIYPFATKAEADAYNVADNRLGELSDWDFPLLKDVLEGIDDGAFDLEQTGFTLDEIENLVTWVKPDQAKNDDLGDTAKRFEAQHGDEAADKYLVLLFTFDPSQRVLYDLLKQHFTLTGGRECDPNALHRAFQAQQASGSHDRTDTEPEPAHR